MSTQRLYQSLDRWWAILPHDVAREQITWERRAYVLRAREAGLTLDQVGALVGRSRERVRQLEAKAMRERRNKASSPAERYFAALRAPAGTLLEIKEYKGRQALMLILTLNALAR